MKKEKIKWEECKLGIPHIVINVSERFYKKLIEYRNVAFMVPKKSATFTFNTESIAIEEV